MPETSDDASSFLSLSSSPSSSPPPPSVLPRCHYSLAKLSIIRNKVKQHTTITEQQEKQQEEQQLEVKLPRCTAWRSLTKQTKLEDVTFQIKPESPPKPTNNNHNSTNSPHPNSTNPPKSDPEKTISAHKLVFAASSPVFATMFTNGMKETHSTSSFTSSALSSPSHTILLSQITFQTLYNLKTLLYTGSLHLPFSHAINLLHAAHMYQIHEIIHTLLPTLSANITLHNYLYLFNIAAQYDYTLLRDSVVKFCRRNVMGICENRRVVELPRELMEEMIRDLVVRNEEVDIILILESGIVRWIEYNLFDTIPNTKTLELVNEKGGDGNDWNGIDSLLDKAFGSMKKEHGFLLKYIGRVLIKFTDRSQVARKLLNRTLEMLDLFRIRYVNAANCQRCGFTGMSYCELHGETVERGFD